MTSFDCFKNMPVLITGHTGFKGAWLSLWLKQLGAKVVGFSLPPPTNPSLFSLTRLQDQISHVEGDIRELDALQHCLDEFQPKVVFHLAAQSLVLPSYDDPKETFDSNVAGTVNVLEAIRHCPSVKAAVIVTSDKCYENKEWDRGYREEDRLGGDDPYSASKAMAELAVASYKASFFKNNVAIATARAGNVIGGGDFSPFRLIPDIIQALIEKQPVSLRSPTSIRPWQHVLEPLSGYLTLANRLLNGQCAEAWNFGPQETHGITTETLTKKAIEYWGEGSWISTAPPKEKAEKMTLRINWEKAAHELNWAPKWTWEQAVEKTIHWYQQYEKHLQGDQKIDFYSFTLKQIEEYTNLKATHALS